ncbi:MAG: glycosyltransferase family 4 protein [Pseudomonadota bacterium]
MSSIQSIDTPSVVSKILIVHNAYQQKGGEDTVVEAEIALLKQYGHSVELFSKTNDVIPHMSRASVAVQTFWSKSSSQDFEKCLRQFQPDIVHVHNTFPLISPAIYWVAYRMRIPVVQTLHNFRLHCPQAMYLRDGKVCEDCIGRVPWRGAAHGCYRDSKVQSAVLAGMVTMHRMLGTWQNKVTRYIALNEFCRQKFIQGGLPADKIMVKANFVDFPQLPAQDRQGLLFVGRLSAEKGIEVLANAMQRIATQQIKQVKLRVAGTGPEAELMRKLSGVTLLGALNGDTVREEMSQASALILPSIWYENFPRTLVEAFGCGLPVIASRIGALAELIEDGVTGLLFDVNNADDLAAKIQWAENNPEKMLAMGVNARNLYEKEFTAARNYTQLMHIYRDAYKAVEGRIQ